MLLIDRLRNHGRRLFQMRSLMPLLLLPCIALALPESSDMELTLGETGSKICQWLAVMISLLGLLLRCATVAYAPDGTSSRDTRALRAPSLNTDGVYSQMRHPLYVGAGLMWLGVALSLRVWWLVVIVGLLYWLYIERVAIAEEAFLLEQFPDQFRAWAARTPAFLPRWSEWRPAGHPFQLKRLLSEHNGLLAVAFLIALLQFLEDQQHGGQSWASWRLDHIGLVRLTAIAAFVSVLCVLIRRIPRLAGGAELSLPSAP